MSPLAPAPVFEGLTVVDHADRMSESVRAINDGDPRRGVS